MWLSDPKSSPDKWSNPLLSLNLFRRNEENGAPGMQPNLYKVVYYQWLIDVPLWKNGPESGPGRITTLYLSLAQSIRPSACYHLLFLKL